MKTEKNEKIIITEMSKKCRLYEDLCFIVPTSGTAWGIKYLGFGYFSMFFCTDDLQSQQEVGKEIYLEKVKFKVKESEE